MTAYSSELIEMLPEEVAHRLGGRKVGNNDWRIPDVCGGERELSDNPGTTIQIGQNGKLVWFCHKHEDQERTGEAIAEALSLPEGTFKPRPAEEMNGQGKLPQLAMNVDELLDMARQLEGICHCCGDAGLEINGKAHSWPMMQCTSCQTEYSRLIKTLVGIMPKPVGFSAIYTSSIDNTQLESYREEPGKIIAGPRNRGSNVKLRPYILQWDINKTINLNDFVLIVEGEFAGAAAANYGYRAYTWRGGKGVWKNSNFQPVLDEANADKNIILWPDDAPAGRTAMMELATSLIEIQGVPVEQVQFVFNNTNTNDDIANCNQKDAQAMINGRIGVQDYFAYFSDEFINGANTSSESQTETEIVELEWFHIKGGYEDIRRAILYSGKEFAYIWDPAIYESPMLVVADEIGYWHSLSRPGMGKLTALVHDSRNKIIQDVREGENQALLKIVLRNLARSVSAMDRNNITANIGTLFHQGNKDSLPVFERGHAAAFRNSGILTLQTQCLEMSTGRVLPKEEVMNMGFEFDPGWSTTEWVPGAYHANNVDASNIRALRENLGETINIVVEMLFKLDRRIAVVRSEASGLGKSALVNLMKMTLGNLVRIGDARDLSMRANDRQFPVANNDHTKARIVVYPEVDKYGLDKLNLGALVQLSGEPFLPTEEKQGDRTEKLRTGNPFVTMGTVATAALGGDAGHV